MPNGPINLPNLPKYDPTRICVISLPSFDIGSRGRRTGVYVSGFFFAAGWWVFFDACILSATMKPPAESPFDPIPIHMSFTDWIPGICSTIGMIVVNLIDKKRLVADGYSISADDGVAWKARLLLFMGFALLAGGLAGSITVLVLKYIIPDWGVYDVNYWGIANVLQNLFIMICTVTLWITQSTEEYEYRLS
ncbi:hypothetical protein BY996DRAFT_6432629 [Phakopsora pachyrhizi]|uniref:Uncharacterized protein n=1 Tax=Phakopsora pachyrhizi TaxID=170000 RepID=A0AAV0AW90_PHAPC|nr:hypothetical protein BY996DRAFT_6432629 [Phakopsora pachyrhizi]CAH7673033.1 hypothetical protein PPACK8108_LOCUS7888 [Phakopsora pachyrhizi]CAH7673437.1 hypothetical protein PPACK8108_LOCUS8301 [Phakopsora pachyrhizi]